MAEVTHKDFKEAIKTIAMYYRKVTQRKECVDFYVKFIEPIKKEVYLREGNKANSENTNCAIFDDSGSLPSNKELEYFVENISRQIELEPADDLWAKMCLTYNFVKGYVERRRQ